MVAENLASDTISRARSSSRPEDLSAVRSAAAGTQCAWGEVSGAVAASIAGIGSWPGPFVRGWLPSESCLLRAGVCRFCRSAWLCPLAGAWALWRGLCVEREPWLRSGAHRVLPHSARSLACLLADLYRTSRPTSSQSGSSKIESPTSQTKLSGI